MSKRPGEGINFIYENIAKFTTNGSDVNADKQRKIQESIRAYLDSGYYYVLLS